MDFYFDVTEFEGKAPPILLDKSIGRTIEWVKPADFVKSSNHNSKPRIHNYSYEILKGEREITPMSYAFFDVSNINLIQNMIKFYVNRKTGLHIGYQDLDPILSIMKYIYITYSEECSRLSVIKTEIKKLNNYVIANIVPSIITEIEGFVYYYNELKSDAPVQLNSINVSSKGTLPNKGRSASLGIDSNVIDFY